jgi:hypothetical protein
VLVYGFGQQNLSFPPNARYFEYNAVDGYDIPSAEVRLREPLRFDYDARWHDFPAGKGAPRIIPLDRADFVWASRLVINGGEFLFNPENNGNAVQIEGYSLAELNQVKMYRFVPTIVESMRLNECVIDNVESDKLIEALVFSGCDIGRHYGATGVNTLHFTAGTMIRESFETCAPQTIIENCELRCVGARSPRVCLTLNYTFAQRLVSISDSKFIVTGREIRALVNGGGEVSFTVGAVLDPSVVLVEYSNDTDVEKLTQRLHEGFVYQAKGGGNRVTVRNIYRYDARTMAIEGVFAQPPRAGEVYFGGNVDRIVLAHNTQSGPRAPVEPVMGPFARNITVS